MKKVKLISALSLAALFFIFVSCSLSQIPEGFVKVDRGSFKMGDRKYVWEKPVHRVKISSFYMAKTEVTQAQWTGVMGTNPSFSREENRPVENLSWYDAIVFCNKLSMLENKRPVYSVNGKTDPSDWNYTSCFESSIRDQVLMDKDADGYRLPTEAEWE